MRKLRLLTRTWIFLYRHERYNLFCAAGLILTGNYAILATWLSKRVVEYLATPHPLGPGGIHPAIASVCAYGVLIAIHGYVSAYTTMQLLGIKDRTQAAADELIMRTASGSSDVMQFEFAEGADRIHKASMGARAIASCFPLSVEVCQYIVAVAGLGLLFARYQPLLALLVAGPAIPLCLWQAKARSRMFSVVMNQNPKYRYMQYCIEQVLGVQQAKEIRAYGSGLLFFKKYKATALEVLAAARQQRAKDTLSTVLWGALAAAGVGGAYIYVIYRATLNALTVGDVVMYSSAAFYFGTSIRSLIQSVTTLSTSILELECFFSYVDQPVTARQRALTRSAAPRASDEPEWKIKDLCFSYPGRDEMAIDSVSFEIGKNERIAIVGLNGAGKSTLMKLMLGLLRPDSGHVAFRGKTVNEWDPVDLRSRFSVVLQEFARFRRLTLLENISLSTWGSAPDKSEGSVLHDAAEFAGLEEIAMRAPQGYNSVLGKEFDGGIELSGGQWQRVALARGVARASEVVFLDEPSASLDANAEQQMFDKLMSLIRNKTAIIMSHRLSVTKIVDRVLVLDGGRLVEEGAHQELMKLGARYAYMYDTQARMYWSENGNR